MNKTDSDGACAESRDGVRGDGGFCHGDVCDLGIVDKCDIPTCCGAIS